MQEHNKAHRLEKSLLDSWHTLARDKHWPARTSVVSQSQGQVFSRFSIAYRYIYQLTRPQRRRLLRKVRVTPARAALAFALFGATNVHAATITTGLNCSLVDAIDAANTDTAVAGCVAGSGADTIVLSGGSYTLNSVNNTSFQGANGLPAIVSDITIEGNGSTIERDSTAPAFRLMFVTGAGDLTLNDSTITGGRIDSPNTGGGILARGPTTLNGSTITDNSSGLSGGGLSVESTVATINRSTVSGNTAEKSGGGIYVNYATLNVNHSTISGNSAMDDNSGGGGIEVFSASLNLNNSTVSGNTTEGSGGGIRNDDSSYQLTGETKIMNSTITGNEAGVQGGGISNAYYSATTLKHSVISGNTAGNIVSPTLVGAGSEIYSSSNYFTVVAPNLFGHSALTTAQALVGFTPSTVPTTTATPLDITATSDGSLPTPLNNILGTLANNGGPTLTHALVDTSPAIDQAASGPATDQRGVARPLGAAFDLGAFELAATTTCNGLPITVNLNTGVGSPGPGPDVILGTPNADTIFSFGGDDTICAGGGDDEIFSGNGDDWVDAGSGDDQVTASNGIDTIYGGLGNDKLSGGPGDDDIAGEEDNDVIYGNSGNDDIQGGLGVDEIRGGSGNDDISTGPGATVGSGVIVDGGAGDDTITGGPDADEIRGSTDNDTIQGHGGNDRLFGGGGEDEISGGDGDDHIRGNAANDKLSGGDGMDNIDGHGGKDIIYGGADDDTLHGATGNDEIHGESGDDTITGGGGNDDLHGEEGIDRIGGQGGNDRMHGGPDGPDECDGGSGVDIAHGSCEVITNVP